MSNVNYGSNYTHRITLRLNDEQHDFVLKVAQLLGVSPSDYIRMSINTGMMAMNKDIEDMTSGKMIEKGMVGMNENVETNVNDIV